MMRLIHCLKQVLMTGLSKLVLRGDLEGATVVAVEVIDAKKGQLGYLVNRQDHIFQYSQNVPCP